MSRHPKPQGPREGHVSSPNLVLFQPWGEQMPGSWLLQMGGHRQGAGDEPSSCVLSLKHSRDIHGALSGGRLAYGPGAQQRGLGHDVARGRRWSCGNGSGWGGVTCCMQPCRRPPLTGRAGVGRGGKPGSEERVSGLRGVQEVPHPQQFWGLGRGLQPEAWGRGSSASGGEEERNPKQRLVGTGFPLGCVCVCVCVCVGMGLFSVARSLVLCECFTHTHVTARLQNETINTQTSRHKGTHTSHSPATGFPSKLSRLRLQPPPYPPSRLSVCLPVYLDRAQNYQSLKPLLQILLCSLATPSVLKHFHDGPLSSSVSAPSLSLSPFRPPLPSPS